MNKLLIIMLLTINLTFGLKLNSQVEYKPGQKPNFVTKKVNPLIAMDPELKAKYKRPVNHPFVNEPLKEYTEGNSSELQAYMYQQYPVERKDGKHFEHRNPYDKVLPDSPSDTNLKLAMNFLI